MNCVAPSDVLNLTGWGFMPSNVTVPRPLPRQLRVMVWSW